jgi:hypothetical protein
MIILKVEDMRREKVEQKKELGGELSVWGRIEK